MTIPEGSGVHTVDVSLIFIAGITWSDATAYGPGDCPSDRYLVEVDEGDIIGGLFGTQSDKICAKFERGDGSRITWDGNEHDAPRGDNDELCPEDMGLIDFSYEKFLFITWSGHITCKGMEDANGNAVEWDPDTTRTITGRCRTDEIVVGAQQLNKATCAKFKI